MTLFSRYSQQFFIVFTVRVCVYARECFDHGTLELPLRRCAVLWQVFIWLSVFGFNFVKAITVQLCKMQS